MNQTIIEPLPTEREVCDWVDTLITPENAEKEAKVLCKLLLAVSNADDDDLYYLATVAANRAFTKTDACRQAFENFAELPARRFQYSADENPIEVGSEQ